MRHPAILNILSERNAEACALDFWLEVSLFTRLDAPAIIKKARWDSSVYGEIAHDVIDSSAPLGYNLQNFLHSVGGCVWRACRSRTDPQRQFGFGEQYRSGGRYNGLQNSPR